MTLCSMQRVVPVALAAALTACGGGGGVPAPGNLAPSLDVADTVMVSANLGGVTPVSLNDDRSPASRLMLTAVAVNSAELLPDAGVRIEGAGSTRNLRIAPAEDALGDAQVALTVTDEDGLSSRREVRVSVVPQQLDLAAFVRAQFGADAAADAEPLLINAVEFNELIEDDAFEDLLETGS